MSNEMLLMYFKNSSHWKSIPAILLLCNSLTSTFASEECIAKSLSQLGKCHKHGFVKGILEKELNGRPIVSERQLPTQLHPDMLATLLMGVFAKGELSAVDGSRTHWVLRTHSAPDKEFSQPQMPEFLTDKRRILGQSFLYLLQFDPSSAQLMNQLKPVVTVLAQHPLSSVTEDGDEQFGGLTGVSDCAILDEGNSPGSFTSLDGRFRWQTLGLGRKVLAVRISRSEGYAGGFGSFAAEVLLDVRNQQMIPIACYSTENYQMFGGNWNPDGSREHSEKMSAWRLFVGNRGEWPELNLRAMTRKTDSYTFNWNINLQQYRLVNTRAAARQIILN